MTLHLCRDFVTLPTASSPGTTMYALSIFLYHVVGYSFIAHRNFPLQSSSYEKGGATLVSGNYQYATINSGANYYSVAADFASASNPSGSWTYGYIENLTSSFVQYDAVVSDLLGSGLVAWYKVGDSGSAPNLVNAQIARMNYNPTASFSGGGPGQFSLHPGEFGEISIARWTAPRTSRYDIDVRFYAGDVGETDAYVRKNGSTIFFSATTSGNPTFVTSSLLNSGDIIDVMVGPTGSNTTDTTPVDIFITDHAAYQVLLPTSSYRVSAADVDRILALKSDAYPQHNSGLFRIISASLSGNYVEVDYRVNTGTLPPHDNRLRWRIYEKETSVVSTWSSASNAPLSTQSDSSLRAGYGGYDAAVGGTIIASASRVILQSPDESAWQVRLCLESAIDIKSGTVPTGMSIAPGYYTAVPPFESPNSRTLHGPLYYNAANTVYRGTAVGLGHLVNNDWTTGSFRINMWGNDFDGTCIIVNRGLTLPHSGWAAFGFPEDEPLVPPNPVTMERLFVMGTPRQTSTMCWRTDFFNSAFAPSPVNCVVWSEANGPIPGTLSNYADISNQTAAHFTSIATAGTSSFGGVAELIDVEILGGMFDTIAAPTTSSIFRFQPRRIGRFPLARQGAGRYGGVAGGVGYVTWSHSSENATTPAWLHTEAGIFLPWNGPPLSGSGTGARIWVISGSVFDNEGLVSFVGNHSGQDPDPDPEPVPFDIDATRYRKTYSYFRQPKVEVAVVKGGSNKSKS